MKAMGIRESDFQESFICSSGPGGQKVNKRATCVYLVHRPTGLSVKCQKERSQLLNRFLAKRTLLDKIEKKQKGVLVEEQGMQHKIRHQKRKRNRSDKERILKDKHKLSEKKIYRKTVNMEDDSSSI